MTDFAPLNAPDIIWRHGLPYCCDYAASYFHPPTEDNADHSPASVSRRVFIAGNRLPERFAGLSPAACFVIAETGFGAGLNYLEAARCFLDHAPATAQLYFISTEKHPLTLAQLADIHRLFIQHRQLANSLRDCYPPACPGFHLLRPHPRIRLLLLAGDAGEQLSLLDARVDAWFLDGFNPTRNPAMWQPAIYREMARLSRPGASLSALVKTATLRHDLEAAGFTTQPLEAATHAPFSGHWPGHWQPFVPPTPRVAIVGAGLAGCTTARSLAEAGCRVEVFDPNGIANGASGNLAGVIYTTPSGNLVPQNRFYQASFLATLRWFKHYRWPQRADDGRLNGVVQLPCQPRLVKKQQAALESGLWPATQLRPADGWPNASICFPEGGYINPPSWCRWLLQHANIRLNRQGVTRLKRDANGWQLFSADTQLAGSEQLLLANAQAAQDFVAPQLPLKLIRGQVTLVAATPASRRYAQAICHQGYFSPAIDGLHCVGASFDLHDSRRIHKPEDDADNLALLKRWLPHLWESLGGDAIKVVTSRVGLRCQSKDFLPLAGATSTAGLWLNIGHGSRGITATPLIAELIKSRLLGLPCPVDREIAAALHPERFKQIERIVATPAEPAAEHSTEAR